VQRVAIVLILPRLYLIYIHRLLWAWHIVSVKIKHNLFNLLTSWALSNLHIIHGHLEYSLTNKILVFNL
jgi:hypothetical protein